MTPLFPLCHHIPLSTLSLLTGFQPYRPHCSLNTSGLLLPLGLCTYISLCLECYTYTHGSNTTFSLRLPLTFLFQITTLNLPDPISLLPQTGLAFLRAELVEFLGYLSSQESLMVVLEVPVGVIMRRLAQWGRLVHPPLSMRACIRGRLPLGPVPEQQEQQQN